MTPKRMDPRTPDAVDLAVGANVRTWRIARGLSQGELAKRLGITFQQVQKYETGHNRMSTGRLAQAAAILGVSLSTFFERAEDREPTQGLLADSRSFRLARAFATIKNIEMRLSIVMLVEKLAKSAPPEKRRR
jgi:transcriptional regulator with XRE-family HTH domain